MARIKGSMTLCTMTLSITTLNIMTHSLTTIRIMTLNIKGLFVSQHEGHSV